MKKFIPAILFIFLFKISFAQYGSGVDGAIINGSGVTYTDTCRLGLTADANSAQPTITVAADPVTKMVNGDWVLVIQMLGTGAGQYEEKTISSRTTTSITFTTNLIYSYKDNGGSNAAQVIRIPQYTTITLKTAGDTITCNYWDGNTGGVCYFKASGTFDADANGVISVAAKGYSGGSGGSGGTGSNGSSWYGPKGTAGHNAGYPGYNGNSSGCGPTFAGGGGGGLGGSVAGASDGGNGGGGGNSNIFSSLNTVDGNPGNSGSTGTGLGGGTSSTAAANNSNSSNWGTTSGTSLLMGGGGAGGKGGYSAGVGASGGGGGFCVGSGNGNPANPDGLGGCNLSPTGVAGGTGGRGGGILIMNVNTIQGTGKINVSGGNGYDGSTGPSGVVGGDGGNGGSSNCGGGGGGKGGIGGSGSCPGHGGAAGSLGIRYFSGSKSGYTFFTNGGSKGAYGSGGTGGTGGVGGNGGLSSWSGNGGPGGYGGWSADGCRGTDGNSGSAGTASTGGTGGTGGAGASPGCNDDSYCTSFSGGGAVILPIELMSFTGFSKGEINILQWITASEINNNYFTLFRSEDMEAWKKISDIKGAGNSITLHMYESIDEFPLKGKINFYQLQQTDFDGKSSSSNIIAIFSEGKSSVYFAENTINIILGEETQAEYQIIDYSGRLVKEESFLKLQQGIYSIDISNLAHSFYLLRIKIGSRLENIKFIKE